jgi:hypothetical protein
MTDIIHLIFWRHFVCFHYIIHRFVKVFVIQKRRPHFSHSSAEQRTPSYAETCSECELLWNIIAGRWFDLNNYKQFRRCHAAPRMCLQASVLFIFTPTNKHIWDAGTWTWSLHSQNPLPSIQQISSVKRLQREADDSPSGSSEVKNKRSYASNPPTCLHGVHRDSRILFTFTFI